MCVCVFVEKKPPSQPSQPTIGIPLLHHLAEARRRSRSRSFYITIDEHRVIERGIVVQENKQRERSGRKICGSNRGIVHSDLNGATAVGTGTTSVSHPPLLHENGIGIGDGLVEFDYE